MTALLRLLRTLPLLLISPLVVLVSAATLALADLLWLLFGRRRPPVDVPCSTKAASIVIPNWNGRDLLEKYLPSVLAAASIHPDNEVIVVDNASTDGSAAFVRENFPSVRLIELDTNRGFGGGSNAGFLAARNEIVVLLNSDMRVEPDFLPPLLEGFTDEKVFSVSCQIFFSDPKKVREETGLTQGWWSNGGLRVRHRIDPSATAPFPCFYGGGGSTAYDRKKFLELGGFDELLAPFYLEDTDIGYLAWKRGWKVLYEPRSVVYHEHRGTIGKKFSRDYIQSVIRKNFILFTWKNIHEPGRIYSHHFFTFAGALVSALFGDSPERPDFKALWLAFRQLPQALRSRWRARSLAIISDTEAFRRPLGGYFRDRFLKSDPQPDRLNVLFLSPYPICPPIHGGAVFMLQTLRELVRHCNVHTITLLDAPKEREAHTELDRICASTQYMVRVEGQKSRFASILPHAVREFANADLEWLIHRQILKHNIDVFQIEYTNMGQYACDFRQVACILFEHDVYFQSIARALTRMSGIGRRAAAAIEYLRALRFELRMLQRVDRIQVCSRANKEYLASFLPRHRHLIQEGLRAGIDTSRYDFRPRGREPFTMLFLGSFRHTPNQEALNWFIRNVLPRVRAKCPQARLVIIGSAPPPKHHFGAQSDAVELHGYVEDVREPLSRYAVFVCPILNGSGVRVKLLEAFAAGIPTVSTRIGAEGLAEKDGEICLLADDPASFADAVIRLFEDPEAAARLAERARAEVEAHWDMPTITRRLVDTYYEAVREKRTRLT
jgi:Predicted glycosyltransferases